MVSKYSFFMFMTPECIVRLVNFIAKCGFIFGSGSCLIVLSVFRIMLLWLYWQFLYQCSIVCAYRNEGFMCPCHGFYCVVHSCCPVLGYF